MHDCIELAIEESGMQKTGILLVVTEFAIAKAIKKIISVSLSNEETVKSLHELVNKITSNIVNETIKQYCEDKEKAKRLKAITKKILSPKKKAEVNGKAVAKIVESKMKKEIEATDHKIVLERVSKL